MREQERVTWRLLLRGRVWIEQRTAPATLSVFRRNDACSVDGFRSSYSPFT